MLEGLLINKGYAGKDSWNGGPEWKESELWTSGGKVPQTEGTASLTPALPLRWVWPWNVWGTARSNSWSRWEQGREQEMMLE